MPVHHEMFKLVTRASPLTIKSRTRPVIASQIRTASAPGTVPHDRRLRWKSRRMNLPPIQCRITSLHVTGCCADRRVIDPAVDPVTAREHLIGVARFDVHRSKRESRHGAAVLYRFRRIQRDLGFLRSLPRRAAAESCGGAQQEKRLLLVIRLQGVGLFAAFPADIIAGAE